MCPLNRTKYWLVWVMIRFFGLKKMIKLFEQLDFIKCSFSHALRFETVYNNDDWRQCSKIVISIFEFVWQRYYYETDSTHNTNSFETLYRVYYNECAPETPSILQSSDKKIQWVSYNRKGGVVWWWYNMTICIFSIFFFRLLKFIYNIVNLNSGVIRYILETDATEQA